MPKNSLQQKTTFNLNLSLSLKNSIELLAMPYDDLLIEINNALEENIVLTENTEKISEYPSTYEKINENDFVKLEYKESLFSNLENQLLYLGLTNEQLNIAHIMVENLTEVGFLEVSIKTIIHIYLRKHPNSQINTQQCDAVKEKMQTNLEPFGIASFNTQDFLLLPLINKIIDQSNRTYEFSPY
jgi:RNA polymerase sigma-54 factor